VRVTQRTLIFSLLVLTFVFLFTGLAQARTYSTEEARFFQLINNYRVQKGLGALQASDTVAEAAARHSLDMGNFDYFSHQTGGSNFFPAGYQPWDRMRSLGYNYSTAMGENIAAGQQTAQQVFDAWRNSSGHNANMLNGSFKVIGIARRAVSGSPYGVYWTTDFGGAVDPSSHPTIVADGGDPFTDVSRADQELWDASWYVKRTGLFLGYPTGSLGAWQGMTHRHVALVLKRAGLGTRPDWEQNYSLATRGEVQAAFTSLSWNSGRPDEQILRSQLVRLLYRAR
jgi:uncharacterized protein YkwD